MQKFSKGYQGLCS